MFALNSLESPPLLPKFTVTNRKTHLLLHLHHHHHHHHHHVKFHVPLMAHFKSTLPSPISASSSPDSSSLTADFLMDSGELSSSSSSPDSSSLTADFLMESGGLSSVQALDIIQNFPSLLKDGGRKPRSVIAYLEAIGFSKTHISKVITKNSEVIVADVEKTLKPKIELFQNFGFSDSDIADLMASKPQILHRSLKTQIKPGLDLIKSFVKTDEDLIKTIRSNGILLLCSTWRKSIEPNVDVLRQHGVPDSEIEHLILSHLTTLTATPEVFKGNVKRIASLGFKPGTRKFTTAVAAICRMNKATWDSKMDLLKSLGWSELQILDCFRRCSTVLTLSRENLKEGIEFYAEGMNWDASTLSKYPLLLMYSLRKRVIPRYAVLKSLMSKEIIRETKTFICMLKLSEEDFLQNYVFKYEDELPDLFDKYKSAEIGSRDIVV